MKYLKRLLSGLIGFVLLHISDFLCNELDMLIDRLDEKAKSTPNPLDDILVDFLRRIVALNADPSSKVDTAGNFIYGLISIILVHISPKIRLWLVDAFDDLREKSKGTPNPYDDIFVDFLYRMFNLVPSD